MKINTITNFNSKNTASRKNLAKNPAPVLSQSFRANAQLAGNNNIAHNTENPIKNSMEQLGVFRASLIAGLGFGARALYYIFDDTDLLDTTIKAGKKLAKKNHKNAAGTKLAALSIASSAAIIIGVVGLLAALYAIYNAPKSMYQGKINAHKKSEQMDLYLGQHKIEKDLYEQVSDRAKAAQTKEELDKVKSQYAMLRMAKNEAPVFTQVSGKFI